MQHAPSTQRTPRPAGPSRLSLGLGVLALVAVGALLNNGNKVVSNTGDRPVQVGSHYHFAETNPALVFDRAAARGHRLDIAAGTAVRFEPGQSREVTLVPYRGARVVQGFRGEVMGGLG